MTKNCILNTIREISYGYSLDHDLEIYRMSVWSGKALGEASVIPLNPEIDRNGDRILPLLYTFPIGNGGSISENSALVRPFKKILKDGKPIGKIHYIFYKEGQKYYVLGSLAYSNGRLIFFPGHIDLRMTWAKDKPILGEGLSHHFDHLTLESNLRRYHLTLLEKETQGIKYEKMNTKFVGKDMILWFVMGVQSADKLEAAPRTQTLRLRWYKQADLNRRYKIIQDARGGIFPVLESVEQLESPFFINFEFFVNLNPSPKAEPPTRLFAAEVPDSESGETKIIDVPTLASIIKPQGFSGLIWIRTSKIKTTLKEHHVVVRDSKEFTD